MRKLVVDGKEWWVKVGRDTMSARSGSLRIALPLTAVTGYSWEDIEEGRHYGNRYGMVTPRMMAEAIRNVVSGGVLHGFPSALLRAVRLCPCHGRAVP